MYFTAYSTEWLALGRPSKDSSTSDSVPVLVCEPIPLALHWESRAQTPWTDVFFVYEGMTV